jgi:hypothetical protein
MSDVNLVPDHVQGSTAVHIDSGTFLLPDRVAGHAAAHILNVPDLSNNSPILIGFSATMRLESVEPIAAVGRVRAVAGIVVNLPEPAISDGRPSLPEYWARFQGEATLLEGPAHIHAIADPNPIWDPATSGWTFPPPPPPAGGGGDSGAGDYRWSMETLPDPGNYPQGWYWLGDHQVPGESHVVAGNEWGVSPGSQPGPSWRSFYPYRPSVSAFDAHIPGEGTIHHAKGLHVNSHYVEHLWLDWGQAMPQPFTWIVVATIMSDPFAGYQHPILDAGRDPDSVGFPRLSASQVSTERRINDNLPYRTSLAQIGGTAQMSTSGDGPLRTRGAPGHHPRMYAAIFNGSQSKLAAYDPFGKFIAAGDVRNQWDYTHQLVVLGRERDWISQRRAANMLVFEIRYWHRALTLADLDAQYAQLSSTHQFDAYRLL